MVRREYFTFSSFIFIPFVPLPLCPFIPMPLCNSKPLNERVENNMSVFEGCWDNVKKSHSFLVIWSSREIDLCYHQPPAKSHQPPAKSYQPPAKSHQPPATSHYSLLFSLHPVTESFQAQILTVHLHKPRKPVSSV